MPPTQPVPAQFNTAEFRRSDGPREHNAASAWSAGRTGQGVTIAVVDTGIDPNNPEFAGRISPLSKDVVDPSRPLAGPDDHGTHVALVAAAGRNDTGIVGIAHQANIMALRADAVGSCAGDAPQDTDNDCLFLDDAIARAVDYASANGAKVINLSLGGEGAGRNVRAAVSAAASRGSLIVISAGNDGLDEPAAFARLLNESGNGGVIIVGSVDAEGQISDFSNKAGSQSTSYLTALGEAICCSYENGQLYVDPQGFIYLMSGTSFSAPQVSGAAALLAQAFPNLTGTQIAQILLNSAFDVGAPGADPVYGRGILDIYRAFQPIGTTSLAGTAQAVALSDVTGTGSPAMGDALGTASLPAIVLDQYQRAFETDLAGTLRGAVPMHRLRQAVGTQQRLVSLGSDKTSLAFSIDASNPTVKPRIGHLQLRTDDAENARVLAARVVSQVAPKMRLGFAYAEGADGLVAQLQGQDRPAFLIAPEASGDAGAFSRTAASLALRRQFGPWGLNLKAETGEAWSGSDVSRAQPPRRRPRESGSATYGLSVDRRLGPFSAALGLSWMAEDRTLLGGRFHDSFGLMGADTVFLEAQAGWEPGADWRFGAAVRHGQTWARDGGQVAPGSQLASTAWSLDVRRRGVFAAADSVAARISQPLRAENGVLNLMLPSGYSYETLLADYGIRSLSLAPTGRELLGEIAWRGPLLGGQAAASLFYRRDPGHYEQLADDSGAALRWSARF